MSSKVFGDLDDYAWKLTWRWAKRTHSGKPKRWVAHRYFGKFDKFRNDRWVFGNRAGADESGSVPHLVKFSWTPIVRHQMVTGTASPDDPDLAGYWTARRQRVKPPLDSYNLRLLTRQDGRCPLCKDHLLSPEQPPQSPGSGNAGGRAWPAGRSPPTTSSTMTSTARRTESRTRLIHASCGRELQARKRRTPAPQPATPRGLLEPCARTTGTTVLRGPRRGNAPGLPDSAISAAASFRRGRDLIQRPRPGARRIAGPPGLRPGDAVRVHAPGRGDRGQVRGDPLLQVPSSASRRSMARSRDAAACAC